MTIPIECRIVLLISIFTLTLSTYGKSQSHSKEYHYTDFTLENFDQVLLDFKTHDINLASVRDLHGIALYNSLSVVEDKIDVYISVRNQKINHLDLVVAGFIYQLKSTNTDYEKLIELDYAYIDELVYMNYKRSISDKLQEGLLVENGKIYKEVLQDDHVIIFNYHPNGHHAMTGAYDAKSMYASDTVRIVDPVKYTTEYEVSLKLNPNAKVGTWKYYDSKGTLIREEKH